MLSLKSVKKSYGPQLVLDIPSTLLDAGVYWLKGPNGAGKSTFLKMISGMIPFEGVISVNGISIHSQPVDYRRLVNYVEAEPLYPPFLRGRDLVDFFKTARAADENQTEKLQETFGIKSFVDNAINTYSSGMVKKLSLVLAFIGQPMLILLDEPLVTIDKETIPALYSLISASAAKGISFIIASHQPLESSSLPPLKELSIHRHHLQQT